MAQQVIAVKEELITRIVMAVDHNLALANGEEKESKERKERKENPDKRKNQVQEQMGSQEKYLSVFMIRMALRNLMALRIV